VEIRFASFDFFVHHILSYSFASIFIIVYMVALLYTFVNYVFLYVYVLLLSCMFRSRYCVSLCCSVYVCVYCTTAAGCQPNCSLQIYIISYPLRSPGRLERR